MAQTLSPIRHGHLLHLSCGHRYFLSDRSEAENRAIYGQDYSPDGAGHNFTVELVGMSCLVVKTASERIKNELDHKFLNQDVSYFRKLVPTNENLARFCFEQMNADGISATVHEGPRQWATWEREGRCTLTRSYKLHCVHRHHNPELSDVENKELYGKCATIHGHEYQIEVGLEGPVDSKTGLVVSREFMDKLVLDEIIKPFDKTALNELIGNTSGEIILLKFYERLLSKVPRSYVLHLKVRETRKNSFYIPQPCAGLASFK